jgi:hypothetical protein
VKPSLDRPCFSRRTQRVALGIAISLPLYALSTGPVFRLIDAGYLPEAAGYIYTPLYPLGHVPGVPKVFSWYVFHVWNVDNGGDITL